MVVLRAVKEENQVLAVWERNRPRHVVFAESLEALVLVVEICEKIETQKDEKALI